MMIKLLLLLLFLSEMRFGSAVPEMLAEFFENKNTHHLVTFSCSATDDHVLLKFISTNNYALMVKSVPAPSGTREALCVDKCLEDLQPDIKLGFAFNIDCETNEVALKHIPRTLFLNARHSWVVWSRGSGLNQSQEGIRRDLDLEVSVSSDVTFAAVDVAAGSAWLQDVYKIKTKEVLNITDAGMWTKLEGIRWTFSQTRLQRRMNLHGLRLSTVMLLTRFQTYEDDQFLDNYYKREMDSVPRRDYQFWRLMEELYNFTSTIVTTNLFGSVINGTFDGLIGKVQNEEVDVGISTVFQTIERMEAVSFVHVHIGYSNFRPVFIFLRPKDKHGIWDLTESFTTKLWFATGILLSFLQIIFHCSTWLHEDTRNELSAMLFVVAILTQRGPPFHVSWLSGRMLTLSGLLFGYLLFTYFSSAIIVKLLSPPPKVDYHLEFLLESDLDVGVENVSYYYFYFTRYPFMILREIYKEKMKSEAAFIPMEEGLARIRTDRYAFGGDMRILYAAAEKTLTDNEKCSLEAIDMIALNIPRSIAIPKYSPYDELLSTGYLLFMERGITHRLDRIWSNPKPACLERDFVPVELHDILFAFVLLASGFAVALLILFTEFFRRNKNLLSSASWKKLDLRDYDFFD